MSVDRAGVLGRRRSEQAELLERARTFAGVLDATLEVQAVVVFGSVARGDFNVWSDIDVLVVAANLPDRWLDRIDALGHVPARVQPMAWTPDEWQHQRRRRNPIATEAVEHGRWLIGSPAVLP
ncbi:MAG: nucleotidyltransferase domain-containing protein [Actinomycetota bacterium]|nr:nucleotidyltransferase domain-containing protein [Actinomycetota bacterium]